MADAKKRQEIEGLLTGPPTTLPQPRTAIVADEDGLMPPPWWRGDDEAYSSSQIAVAQAARR